MLNARLLLVAIALTGLFLMSSGVSAETKATNNRGLAIAPLRQYTTVDAGTSKKNTLTIANLTDKSIDVTLSAEQFSVANYTYDYNFAPLREDWIKLGFTKVKLEPFKTKQVPYVLSVPVGSTPGGHYFTLFASTQLNSAAGVYSKVRVASVLYVTVSGELDRSSVIQKDDMPWLFFDKFLPYRLDVRNTGNTHFFIYTSGKLEGLSVGPPQSESAHILLPDTMRTITSKITAPGLPGIYKATYGYKTDTGKQVQRSKYVVYVPPWILLLPIGLGLSLPLLIHHRRKGYYKTTGS